MNRAGDAFMAFIDGFIKTARALFESVIPLAL